MSRRARRGAGLLTAMVVAVLPLAATLSGPSAAAADDDTPSALSVTLTALTPVAPQPGQDLVLTGRIQNTTSSAIADVDVQLRISGAVGSRGAFDEYADTPDAAPPDTLTPLTFASVTPAVGGKLAAGASERFRISEPVDNLGLGTTWQVRELGVVVTGATEAGLPEYGALRTFLPWAPRQTAGHGKPIQLAWVWPLADRPHRGVSSTWLDDDLAPELTSQGRLGQLLSAGNHAEHPAAPPGRRHHRHPAAPRAVPLTWAVDPLLVQDTNLMSKGYVVRGTDGRATPGAGKAAAAAWLSALRSGVNGQDVLPLPYADTDLVAAIHGNLGGEAQVATAAGRTLLRQDLPTGTLLPTSWPVNGLADQRTLDTMFGTGSTSVLLSSNALPIVGGQPPETPSARTSVLTGNGALETILFDAGLTSVVDKGASDSQESPLELQRFLAETLMIVAEQPNDQRSIVVAPNRRWQPSAGYADSLLSDTSTAPWITPVSLSSVLSSPPYTKVTRGPLDYPNSARRDELGPSYLHQVRQLKSQLVGFGTVLSSGTPTVAGYDAAVQRLLSSAYRTDIAARNTALNAVRHNLTAAMSQVHITTHRGSYITLTSHNGKVPITIANNLDTPVHVVLQVDANQRLGLSNAGRTSVPIPPNTQVFVAVRAIAKTSGVFPLQVRLLTPGLRPYGPPIPLYVRSTAYGTITLVITAAATVALLIAVGFRLTRRAMRSRRVADSPA